MPIKSKKSKGSKAGKGKTKDSKGSKKKKDSKKSLDPALREAAHFRALEAKIYFQTSDLNTKELEVQKANEFQKTAEENLKTFTDSTKEISAFTSWQHEHTVEKLMDKINELTLNNMKIKKEKEDLQMKLNNYIEESNAKISEKEAEIAKLSTHIKESHYKYERAFSQFADSLVESLTQAWKNEKPFLTDLQEVSCKEFLQSGLINTFSI